MLNFIMNKLLCHVLV